MIESFNQNAEVKQYVQDYAVLELLGAGAFGSVYKVKKKSGQSYLAMKEVIRLLSCTLFVVYLFISFTQVVSGPV